MVVSTILVPIRISPILQIQVSLFSPVIVCGFGPGRLRMWVVPLRRCCRWIGVVPP